MLRTDHEASIVFTKESLDQRQRAGERIRTVDIQLGKLSLYQLSYTRVSFQYSENASRLTTRPFVSNEILRKADLVLNIEKCRKIR